MPAPYQPCCLHPDKLRFRARTCLSPGLRQWVSDVDAQGPHILGVAATSSSKYRDAGLPGELHGEADPDAPPTAAQIPLIVGFNHVSRGLPVAIRTSRPPTCNPMTLEVTTQRPQLQRVCAPFADGIGIQAPPYPHRVRFSSQAAVGKQSAG